VGKKTTRVIVLSIQGKCRVDPRTKDLVQRILPHEIAVVNHIDLDEMAAESLLKKRIKALINAAPSLSGRYPALGTAKLLSAGIPIIDMVDPKIMELEEGTVVEIAGHEVRTSQQVYAGRRLDQQELSRELAFAEKNFLSQLESFALNTFDYALKEMSSIFSPLVLPPLKLSMKGKHVLIVVRGRDYKEDLQAIVPYIKEAQPVLIGVDGGADALMEEGYRPDIILGDMDSVSDKALKWAKEIIVHAYPDGLAPGADRIDKLNLPYHKLPAPGTSEDVAMLLAFESGAELIVALGTHTNPVDFLNKGREGMASTFLVRLKVGTILVDAKGVNKLYRQKLKGTYVAKLIAAALLPVTVIALIHPSLYQIIRLLWIRMRFILGF
jgi:uncharacterized membrane-anchored protein